MGALRGPPQNPAGVSGAGGSMGVMVREVLLNKRVTEFVRKLGGGGAELARA